LRTAAGAGRSRMLPEKPWARSTRSLTAPLRGPINCFQAELSVFDTRVSRSSVIDCDNRGAISVVNTPDGTGNLLRGMDEGGSVPASGPADANSAFPA